MKCPSCATAFSAPVPECPKCQLTLAKLESKFGSVPRHSSYLTDRTERVALDDLERLRDELRLFHRRFPQCLFSVFIADLPPKTHIGEYAFWLANRARFNKLAQVRAENFDLLLLVDFESDAAALTAGYGVERHLSEEELQHALQLFAAEMERAGVTAGLEACLTYLTLCLRRASRAAASRRSKKDAKNIAPVEGIRV